MDQQNDDRRSRPRRTEAAAKAGAVDDLRISFKIIADGENGGGELHMQRLCPLRLTEGDAAVDCLQTPSGYPFAVLCRDGLPTRRSWPQAEEPTAVEQLGSEYGDTRIHVWLSRGESSRRLTPDVGLTTWMTVAVPAEGEGEGDGDGEGEGEGEGLEMEGRRPQLQLYGPECDGPLLLASAPPLSSDDRLDTRHTYTAFDESTRALHIRMGRGSLDFDRRTHDEVPPAPFMGVAETLAYYDALLREPCAPGWA